MNETKSVILKIGGSVITDKNVELAARTQVIDRLAYETQRANVKNLIVVHGGGSFGHPVARRNAIKEGLRNPDQINGFAETHHFMTVLNGLVMDAFITRTVPAISITPSSCVTTENGTIRSFEDSALKMSLKLGFLPVLYGDAVLDSKLGFTILSGDRLVSVLATKFNAERVIIGVDVDGLCDADPKAEKTAKAFAHLTLEEAKKLQSRLGESIACDVTGGMSGKIAELLPVVERGIPVTLINAAKSNYVFKALKGEKVDGTVIEKE